MERKNEDRKKWKNHESVCMKERKVCVIDVCLVHLSLSF